MDTKTAIAVVRPMLELAALFAKGEPTAMEHESRDELLLDILEALDPTLAAQARERADVAYYYS